MLTDLATNVDLVVVCQDTVGFTDCLMSSAIANRVSADAAAPVAVVP
jgi:hypothetical protein